MIMASLAALALAWVLTTLLLPLAIRTARAWRIMDIPDQRLKQHDSPVPYLGGAAVFLGFALALMVIKWVTTGSLIGVVGVLAGASLVALLGLIDDLFALSPLVKFFGQTAAALVLVATHIQIRFISPEWIAIGLTLLWVVAITNAYNLIDIMDGLCGGVGAIAAAALCAVSLISGRANDTLILAPLLGALLAFLPFNFPRAKIYLGDCGALLVGFVLAAMTVGEEYSSTNPLALLAPLLILGVPIFDTLFIMGIRYRRGVSMFKGSPDHLALRLVKIGWSKTQTVLALWGATLVLSLLAIWSMFLPLQWSLFIYGSAAMGALFAAERLGRFPMPPEVGHG
jgi:UDP-GlcNAc:undecaprenyl-phosphate GlcNAc-1-phosphate transferase